MMQAITRKYSGVLLSPTARIIFEHISNNVIAGIPQSIVIMYIYASEKISSGVFKRRSRLFKKQILKVIKTAVITALNSIPQAKLRRTPRSSPAPKRWAVRMDAPCVKPIINPSIKKLMLPVLPTAASARVPIVLLTIKESAIL